MSALASSVSTFIDGLLYRGREGHWLYIGHRLAGLGTLLFLAIHIVDTSFAYFSPWLEPIVGAVFGLKGNLYNHALELYRNPVFMVGEILLVAAVIYHGVNGLKIILGDTFPQLWNKAPERSAFWRVAVITAILWAPAAFLMGRNLYWHSLCNCAPETTVNVAAVTNFALVSIPVMFVVILGVLVFGGSFQTVGVGGARKIAVPARNLETYAWLFMRWSGALLIPLVWIHVLLQDVLVGVHVITIDYVALRWATLGWQVYDITLLAFAFAHGMNGLRAVAEDYIHHPGAIKTVKWLIFLGWLAITAVGAVAIIRGVQG